MSTPKDRVTKLKEEARAKSKEEVFISKDPQEALNQCLAGKIPPEILLSEFKGNKVDLKNLIESEWKKLDILNDRIADIKSLKPTP